MRETGTKRFLSSCVFVLLLQSGQFGFSCLTWGSIVKGTSSKLIAVLLVSMSFFHSLVIVR